MGVWGIGGRGGGDGGRDVRPASQDLYPIYDQNLLFCLPFLWPDQKFDTLFQTRLDFQPFYEPAFFSPYPLGPHIPIELI